MALTIEEVRHIARLARLELDEEALETYRQQLSAILDYFSQLSELDTDSVLPAAGQTGAGGMRADDPRPGMDREDLRRNAPDWHEGQYRVPPILE